MCGIFGFNFEDAHLLRKMASVLNHRGPDGRGAYVDKNISLGHCRLKIIDLSNKAKQPMSNETESIWLTYNGEIYNFRELRSLLEEKGHRFKSHTDSEVIVHGYEEWGLDVIRRLRGIFAFGIYDDEKKELYLVRDRIGVKPLYYYWDGKTFLFASEVKAILQYAKPELCNPALDQFFTFQYTISPVTLFESIHKLQAGHYLKLDFENNSIEVKDYWNLKTSPVQFDESTFINMLENKIKEAVKLRLISDVPLGIYLSGGLDSSYIAAVAKELKDDIKAYTVSFFDEDESEFASEVASALDLEHRIIRCRMDSVQLLPRVIWHLDKPAVNIASVPLYAMARESKKYLTVALMGDGGDEIFAGYEKYRLLAIREKLKKFPVPVRRFIACIPLKKETRRRLKRFLTSDDVNAYLSYISSFDSEERRQLLPQLRPRKYEQLLRSFLSEDILQGAFLFDIKTLLPDDYLMKVDKTTMASAVEARVPYLDHELVELAMRIPPELKLRGLKTKAFFRKVVKKKLPKRIVRRKKHGFNVPTRKWMSSGLEELALQLVDVAPDIINRRFAENIIKKFRNNPRYYSRQLWSIVTFIIWYRMYFEMCRPEFDINRYVS